MEFPTQETKGIRGAKDISRPIKESPYSSLRALSGGTCDSYYQSDFTETDMSSVDYYNNVANLAYERNDKEKYLELFKELTNGGGVVQDVLGVDLQTIAYAAYHDEIFSNGNNGAWVAGNKKFVRPHMQRLKNREYDLRRAQSEVRLSFGYRSHFYGSRRDEGKQLSDLYMFSGYVRFMMNKLNLMRIANITEMSVSWRDTACAYTALHKVMTDAGCSIFKDNTTIVYTEELYEKYLKLWNTVSEAKGYEDIKYVANNTSLRMKTVARFAVVFSHAMSTNTYDMDSIDMLERIFYDLRLCRLPEEELYEKKDDLSYIVKESDSLYNCYRRKPSREEIYRHYPDFKEADDYFSTTEHMYYEEPSNLDNRYIPSNLNSYYDSLAYAASKNAVCTIGKVVFSRMSPEDFMQLIEFILSYEPNKMDKTLYLNLISLMFKMIGIPFDKELLFTWYGYGRNPGGAAMHAAQLCRLNNLAADTYDSLMEEAKNAVIENEFIVNNKKDYGTYSGKGRRPIPRDGGTEAIPLKEEILEIFGDFKSMYMLAAESKAFYEFVFKFLKQFYPHYKQKYGLDKFNFSSLISIPDDVDIDVLYAGYTQGYRPMNKIAITTMFKKYYAAKARYEAGDASMEYLYALYRDFCNEACNNRKHCYTMFTERMKRIYIYNGFYNFMERSEMLSPYREQIIPYIFDGQYSITKLAEIWNKYVK